MDGQQIIILIWQKTLGKDYHSNMVFRPEGFLFVTEKTPLWGWYGYSRELIIHLLGDRDPSSPQILVP